MAKIEPSRVVNEELCKTNENLRKNLHQRVLLELVPPHYITPKIVFTRVEDHENHLTTFNAQVIVSRGADVIQCKIFMSTFTGTTLQ